VTTRDVDRFFVGGEWVEPSGGERVDVLNPATEETIATAAVPDAKDAIRAIEAAREAFDQGPWPRMPVAERAAALRRMGESLRARKRELIDLVIDEVGATVLLAKTFQAGWGIDAFEQCARWAEEFAWEREVPDREQPVRASSVMVHEPVGVVVGITPFNYPFFVNAWKVAPAIAMGNTIVLKPAPWTPLDAFETARAAEEAELPPGVVNVIGGGGIDVGEELVSNPRVDMVSFTGSVPAGRRVGALAAQTIKKVQLELGGKSAAIALEDADPAAVVMNAISGCMTHAGQGCGCTTRLLLPESAHDAVVEQLVDTCASLPVGDPRDESTVVGPLIRGQHRERVEGYVGRGVEEGATLAVGGTRPDRPGFFFAPTVFTDVTPDMTIAREEIFGPVLSVFRYRDLDEAIRIANDSTFGLAGAVISPDRKRAKEVAMQLRTGYVGLGIGVPNFNGSWGGYKQSGVGREWRDGLAEYTETKHITWLA
jgi:aldehyde dehydrogenase (NAD+)